MTILIFAIILTLCGLGLYVFKFYGELMQLWQDEE